MTPKAPTTVLSAKGKGAPREVSLIRTSRDAPFHEQEHITRKQRGAVRHQDARAMCQGPGGHARRLRFRGAGCGEGPETKRRKMDSGFQAVSSVI